MFNSTMKELYVIKQKT
ncbi:glial cells missing related [Schistosoma mansoni]|uniref:Uncharacterized protein n=1 Tax=Schistosoma mansoni TaxID=6183 RepID=G4M1E8_SCHMA|nr:glial cells missing related [Schistosoma mansoni]|eukprot:XP_018647304.1 glial cells missing related [Schistosoma mansoni]